MSQVIAFPPKLHKKVAHELAASYKKQVEVYKCTACGSTDNFRLHPDGSVVCMAEGCNIWQPLACFEPNVKE